MSSFTFSLVLLGSGLLVFYVLYKGISLTTLAWTIAKTCVLSVNQRLIMFMAECILANNATKDMGDKPPKYLASTTCKSPKRPKYDRWWWTDWRLWGLGFHNEYGKVTAFEGQVQLVSALLLAKDRRFKYSKNPSCSAVEWINLSMFDVPKETIQDLLKVIPEIDLIGAESKEKAILLPDMVFETYDIHSDRHYCYTVVAPRCQVTSLRHNTTSVAIYFKKVKRKKGRLFKEIAKPFIPSENKRTFWVDVGKCDPSQSAAFIERMKEQFSKKKKNTPVEERWKLPVDDDDIPCTPIRPKKKAERKCGPPRPAPKCKPRPTEPLITEKHIGEKHIGQMVEVRQAESKHWFERKLVGIKTTMYPYRYTCEDTCTKARILWWEARPIQKKKKPKTKTPPSNWCPTGGAVVMGGMRKKKAEPKPLIHWDNFWAYRDQPGARIIIRAERKFGWGRMGEIVAECHDHTLAMNTIVVKVSPADLNDDDWRQIAAAIQRLRKKEGKEEICLRTPTQCTS